MERRRRTDRLPLPAQLPADPLARGRAACDHATMAGFAASCALVIPDDGSQGVLAGASGRIDPILDIARGAARSIAGDGAALRLVDVDGRGHATAAHRHAAVPLG
ncbi:MAG: hypothetical protein KDC46_11110, partial [Thermoleophilia bacterium]|nr:hypothetical protein [Thermoleophilia bacterium]